MGKEQVSDWQRWEATYEVAWAAPDSVPDLECPNCGKAKLRLSFSMFAPNASSALAAFWCDSCLVGIAVHAPLPGDVQAARNGDESIPNFALVAPDG